MELLIWVIISVLVPKSFPKKYLSTSDESIENLLYYKDCLKPKTTTQKIETKPPPPIARQNDCPFPKMCCTMSCGNDCGPQSSFLSRQMEPLQNLEPIQPFMQPPFRNPGSPVQPQLHQRTRKKRIKPAIPMAFGGRRDFGYTKEKIKSLIAQDDDIRKILKDLVRVTMQKADLMDMVNTRRNNSPKVPEYSGNSDEEE